ncbi:hypothetical protein DJ564_07010 [Pseudomonas sp. 31-12]|nr:hypothetical protein DJ564_07010 [Pseudomonas sp. 31-12]
MGASLLAIAVCQSISTVNISAQSRAGSLPHWIAIIHRMRAHGRSGAEFRFSSAASGWRRTCEVARLAGL